MKIVTLVLFGLLLALPVRAQQSLTPLTPAAGHIERGGSQQWTFSAVEGNVVSLAVTASGDLDPKLTISSSAGVAVLANDDYHYPDSGDSLLEAVTIPRTDTYTATVDGMSGTSGDYSLTLLPGYGQIHASENFGGETGWADAVGPVEIAVADGQLALTLNRVEQIGIAANTSISLPQTYYAEVAVSVTTDLPRWTVGMSARQSGTRYYLLTINERGEWRFVVRDGGAERVIRDWVTHPAIAAGRKTFTLAMLVNHTNFDFFYDRLFIGRLSDPTIPEGGTLGLAVQTTTRDTSASASFDDLTVTSPVLVNGATTLPTQLIVGTPAAMVQELQRRNAIPSGGTMALNVSESFAESTRPGVERFMLGRGSTFRTFALGTTFTWEAGAAGMTGCGLVFDQTTDTDYLLAYADRTGGFGLSHRQGDRFEPGIFGEKPIGSKTSYHLLVVSLPDRVLYYVDGFFAGMLDRPAAGGSVGNAVVNFEPIATSCRFAPTWVWSWDESPASP